MSTQMFDGSSLLVRTDLLSLETDRPFRDSFVDELPLDRLAASIRRAFTGVDNEGALLVVELDNADVIEPEQHMSLLDTVAEIARSSIRRTDVIDRISPTVLGIALPGSGRIGMIRVADAIRQRVAAAPTNMIDIESTRVTIGAVHTAESELFEPDDLLLAALVNLDSARAAGGGRINWSDYQKF